MGGGIVSKICSIVKSISEPREGTALLTVDQAHKHDKCVLGHFSLGPKFMCNQELCKKSIFRIDQSIALFIGKMIQELAVKCNMPMLTSIGNRWVCSIQLVFCKSGLWWQDFIIVS